MVRAALFQKRRIGQGPRTGAAYIPAATVVAASLLNALPIVATSGWYPDFGYLALIAWRLLRSEPWPAWWAAPLGFWNDPDGSKYRAAYYEHFPGVWRHGDWCEITAHDGLVIYGRSDAVLNPGGVRIGTAEIYRQVETLPEVLESLVVGQETGAGSDRDVRVVLFVRLAAGHRLDDALRERIRRAIRDGASPHHVPKVIVAVADVPRTISGKITELAVREVIHGRPVRNVEALANPAALDLFRDLPELRG